MADSLFSPSFNMGSMATPGQAAGNPYLGQNPYLDSTIQKSQNDLVRSYNTAIKPAMESSMARSGSFGNTGLQEMQGQQQMQLSDALGNISNQARMQDYGNQQNMYRWDQGFNRDLYNDAFGQNMQNTQLGLSMMGNLQQANQNDIGNATNIHNQPANNWSLFSNAANSMGQGYGTNTSSMSGGGSSPFTSALGGAQIGSAFGRQMGWGQPSGNSTNGNGGYSTGGASYNNPSAYGGREPYMVDNNTYNPVY